MDENRLQEVSGDDGVPALGVGVPLETPPVDRRV